MTRGPRSRRDSRRHGARLISWAWGKPEASIQQPLDYVLEACARARALQIHSAFCVTGGGGGEESAPSWLTLEAGVSHGDKGGPRTRLSAGMFRGKPGPM